MEQNQEYNQAFYEMMARKFMKEIMYDNGMVDRNHPEEYPKWHVKAIAEAVKGYVEANEPLMPGLLEDENINMISTGEDTEVLESFGHLEGFDKLHKSLDAYFNAEPTFDQIMSYQPISQDIKNLMSQLVSQLEETIKAIESQSTAKRSHPVVQKMATNMLIVVANEKISMINALSPILAKVEGNDPPTKAMKLMELV